MAAIGINYSGRGYYYDSDDELIKVDPSDPNYLKYESVYIHYQGGEKLFECGNFVKDWFNAKKFYQMELMDKEPYLNGSSSCDHFHMDGANFDSAYLHIVDDKPVLKYVDETDSNYRRTQRDIYENGWEFFVEQGTRPTWNELVEYCK